MLGLLQQASEMAAGLTDAVHGSNAIALLVVLPLLAAPLCVILRSPRLAWATATAASWITCYLCLGLAEQVLDGGVLTYHMGGWAPPVGIEYRIDAASGLLLSVVSVIGSLVMLFARDSVPREIPESRQHLFYGAYCLCFAGLLGMVATGDLFNLFVFLEISSLSTYVLVAIGRDRRALTAAFRYLLVGTVGATFYLIGVGYLYMMTGTLNMGDMAERLAGTIQGPPTGEAVYNTTTVRAALALITVGLSTKMALFPLHVWLPNVYTYAPSVVSAFLSATATKVAVYVMLRVFYTVDGQATDFTALPIADTLVPLAVLGALVASLVAIYQGNAKRALAWSSIAQVGYMVLGIGLASQAGLRAGLLHLVNHAAMKGALFMALGCMIYRVGSARIVDLHGLGRQMPWTCGALVIGALSLIGVPLTAGFTSKWALVTAILEQQQWFVAVLVLISSLLAVAYCWQIVMPVVFGKRPADAPPVAEAPFWMLVPTLILAGANIWFGLSTGWTGRLSKAAAEALLEAPR